jgi:hypothetical protein
MISWNTMPFQESAMKIEFGPSSFNLPAEGVVLLHEARGARVLCLSGALWLTQEGRQDDTILQPGESLRITRGGLTLMTALRSSEVRVIEPCKSGREWLRRVLAKLPAPMFKTAPTA